MFDFPLQLEPEPDGSAITVTSRDVPQLVTYGKDLGEALLQAADALAVALEFYTESGRDIPRPSRPKRGEHVVRPGTLVCAKLAAYQEIRNRRISKASLARQLGWHRQQMDRVLDLRHASKLDQVESVLGALGLVVRVEIEKAA